MFSYKLGFKSLYSFTHNKMVWGGEFENKSSLLKKDDLNSRFFYTVLINKTSTSTYNISSESITDRQMDKIIL